MNEISEFDELGAKVEAAYLYHSRIYALKNPPPEKGEVATTDKVVIVGLVLMVLASVIVSGSRTINEFGGGIVGFAAFAMLEISIVIYAYIRTKRHYDKARHKSLKKQMTAGILMALAVATVANIHAIAKENNVYVAEWVDTIILLLVAISAPILAFVSGDILGMEAVAAQNKQENADKVYERKMRTWKAGLNRSWEREKAKLGVEIRVSAPDGRTGHGDNVRPLSALPDGQNHGYGQGYQRRTDAQDTVRSHLEAHPEDMALTVRELADKLNVGKTTVSDVIRSLRTPSANGNGHYKG